MNIKIKAFIPQSFIDYPGRMSSVIFTAYCNFRCHYCQNAPLVRDELPDIDLNSLEKEFLKAHKWCEAICISGGEPTIWKEDLIRFIEYLKRWYKLIKLDTNGSNPLILELLIKKRLVDYISMDVKTILNENAYNEITNTKVNISDIKRSIAIIKDSGIPHEFRMTILPRYHNRELIEKWRDQLTGGASRLKLQNFSTHETLNPSFKDEKTFSISEFRELESLVQDVKVS